MIYLIGKRGYIIILVVKKNRIYNLDKASKLYKNKIEDIFNINFMYYFLKSSVLIFENIPIMKYSP